MDVDSWKVLFHGGRELDVEVSIHVGRQAGLNANFGRAHFNGLAHATKNLIQWKQVSLFAAIGAAECAKPAMLHADVREVDIAIDHIRNNFSDLTPPQFVSGGNGRLKLGSARLTEPQAVLPGDLFAFQGMRENGADGRIDF